MESITNIYGIHLWNSLACQTPPNGEGVWLNAIDLIAPEECEACMVTMETRTISVAPHLCSTVRLVCH